MQQETHPATERHATPDAAGTLAEVRSWVASRLVWERYLTDAVDEAPRARSVPAERAA